jgi:hypothetical protein
MVGASAPLVGMSAPPVSVSVPLTALVPYQGGLPSPLSEAMCR